jgi:hypothetical protein
MLTLTLSQFCHKLIDLLATIVDLVGQRRALEEDQFRLHIQRPIVVHGKANTPIDRTCAAVQRTVRVIPVVCVVKINPAVRFKLRVNCHGREATTTMKQSRENHGQW